MLIQRRAMLGLSTDTPAFDFETFSEAGYVRHVKDDGTVKWFLPSPSYKTGLGVVGAAAYAEHHSTIPITLSYDLLDGVSTRTWMHIHWSPPIDICNYVAAGGRLEAHNAEFEYFIWMYTCVGRLYPNWPVLQLSQLTDSMAKSAMCGLPLSLEGVSNVLRTSGKTEGGKKILDIFSKPQTTTKKNPGAERITIDEDPVNFLKLIEYNRQDVRAETEISHLMPDLSTFEEEVFRAHQRVNARGIHIDRDALLTCIKLLEEARPKYNAELLRLTDNTVRNSDDKIGIHAWLNKRGVTLKKLNDAGEMTDSLAAEVIEEHLKLPYPPDVIKVLKIRMMLGTSSVAKFYQLLQRMNSDNRLRGCFVLAGATQTRRWSGRGPQPHNLPNPVIQARKCNDCGKFFSVPVCPHCGSQSFEESYFEDDSFDFAFETAKKGVAEVERVFGDPMDFLVTCVRGLFTASPGHDLIGGDFTAIEAVVLAVIAGEQWRIDVFNSHGKIYEASASKISGVPLEEILDYKKRTGKHHPLRKGLGKVAELASGYQGWINAWKRFGADEFFDNDQQIQDAIMKWRAESPQITKLWRELEKAAANAIESPGTPFDYKFISFCKIDRVLYMRLPSGGLIHYWDASVQRYERYGKPAVKIIFYGTDAKTGKWVKKDTYGGRLTENAVQAIARDIQAAAIRRLDARYPIVMHIHDEDVAEVLKGYGSDEEFRTIMAMKEPWFADWPIKVGPCWRGRRFRKD